MNPLTILGAISVSLALPVLWWALSGAPATSGTASRNLLRGDATDLRTHALARPISERAGRPLAATLARLGRALTPAGLMDKLERRLVLAGRPASWPIERVLAAKLTLGAAVGLLALTQLLGGVGPAGLLLWLAAPVVAFFLPDVIVGSQAATRQSAIQLALPDTLDQLTVCVEAGLGFDAAMARAGRGNEGPLADELLRTLQDMQIGSTRADALRSLTDRTEVAELRRLVLVLLQAESYGLSIADVLRVQAAELREKRRQRAEERAMKVPVKILVPLIFFILPTLFIVILGPAGINVIDMFSGLPAGG